MNEEQIKQIKEQLVTIAKSFNGYNGEVLLHGIQTRLEMSKAIDIDMVNPKTGNVTQEDAKRLLQIATNIITNDRLEK